MQVNEKASFCSHIFFDNPLSTLELNLAIVCTSLPPIKILVQRFGSRILGTIRSGTFAVSGSKSHSSKHTATHSATLHVSRTGRKRPGQPDEESKMDGSYLELVDRKLDQNC